MIQALIWIMLAVLVLMVGGLLTSTPPLADRPSKVINSSENEISGWTSYRVHYSAMIPVKQ